MIRDDRILFGSFDQFFRQGVIMAPFAYFSPFPFFCASIAAGSTPRKQILVTFIRLFFFHCNANAALGLYTWPHLCAIKMQHLQSRQIHAAVFIDRRSQQWQRHYRIPSGSPSDALRKTIQTVRW
jgi:hypothetical protein